MIFDIDLLNKITISQLWLLEPQRDSNSPSYIINTPAIIAGGDDLLSLVHSIQMFDEYDPAGIQVSVIGARGRSFDEFRVMSDDLLRYCGLSQDVFDWTTVSLPEPIILDASGLMDPPRQAGKHDISTPGANGAETICIKQRMDTLQIVFSTELMQRLTIFGGS